MPAVSSGDAEFFEKSVRPVLIAQCHTCHGAKKQEYGLRLDTRAGLLKGSDGGPVVVPGKPDESPLIEAIRHAGGVKMPPDGKLPAADIAALTDWVRRGAPWPADTPAASRPIDEAAKSHWAFQPIGRPRVPDVKCLDRVRTPVDRFVLAKLEAAGLEPSPEADRRTLLRRLAFDLVGLPPTPEEAAEFFGDERPDAYERLVDRLLASPHYGERWGRYWLDVGRYADTKGYVFFEDAKYPWAWTWRDYVVNAFNEDLPFDRFLHEQLAADLLPDARPETLAALGFLTAGNRFMGNQHDILDDRIDVVGRGVLGLTLGCARCHDHKYDPIPSADYYSLYGVFRSAREPLVPPLLHAPPATDEYRKYSDELWRRLQRMDRFVDQKFTELTNGGRTRAAEYLMAAFAVRNQPSTENFMLITDKGDLNPTMIVRWQKYLDETRKSKHPAWVVWHRFADLFDAPGAGASGGAAGKADGTRSASQTPQQLLDALAAEARQPAGGDTRWTINPVILAAFTSGPAPSTMQEVAKRYADALAAVDRQWRDLPALAEAPGTTLEGSVPQRLPDDAEEELRRTLYGPDAPASLPRMLGWGFLSLLPDRASQEDFKKLLKEIETWAASGPGAPPRAMTLVDEPTPYAPRVFLRGNPNRPGPEVPRQGPAILSSGGQRQPFAGGGRLELAELLTRADNPLTARVLANRIWLHHFGQGLVATAGDFGLRSDPPTHPELLDWLAAEVNRGWLMGNGQRTEKTLESKSVPRPSRRWSVKHLHRMIVLSATYRQTSHRDNGGPSTTPSSINHQSSTSPAPSTLNPPPSTSPDPENRLLGRMNRRRLDFEALRDAFVAVSGSLDATLGGPPVTILSGFSPRRTLYGFLDRQDLPPLYRDFDFPDPAASSPQRETTTVPPQALFLMNNPFGREAATRLLNRRDVAALPDRTPAERAVKLDRIHQILFARSSTEQDRQLAAAFLGESPPPAQWTRYVHALLLTNEFAFVD